MRLVSLAMLGMAIVTTPVLAKPAPEVGVAKAACNVKLEAGADGVGYKMVRTCEKSAKRKPVEGLAIARQPIADASNFADGNGEGVLVSLFAISAFVGGIVFATDGSNTVLPDDGDSGIDPASP